MTVSFSFYLLSKDLMYKCATQRKLNQGTIAGNTINTIIN